MNTITNLVPPYTTQRIGEHRLIDVMCKHDVAGGRVLRVVFDLLVEFLFGRNPFDGVRTLTLVMDDVGARLKLVSLLVRRAAYIGAFVKHRVDNRMDALAHEAGYPDFVESGAGNSVRLLRLEAARTSVITEGYIVVCMARGRIGKAMQQLVEARLRGDCVIAVVQHRAQMLQECFPLGALVLEAERSTIDPFGGLDLRDRCALANAPFDCNAILRIGDKASCADSVVDEMEKALVAIGAKWNEEN